LSKNEIPSTVCKEFLCFFEIFFIFCCRIIFLNNSVNWSNSHTCTTIDANIWIYIKMICTLFDAINREDRYTFARFLTLISHQKNNNQYITPTLYLVTPLYFNMLT